MVQTDEELRDQALKQLRKKREFSANLFAYVLVNAFLVGIWAVTGAGFFWPVFPILGWGLGLFFHAWDVYQRPPTEEQILREMDRLK
jgi:2TM domain